MRTTVIRHTPFFWLLLTAMAFGQERRDRSLLVTTYRLVVRSGGLGILSTPLAFHGFSSNHAALWFVLRTAYV